MNDGELRAAYRTRMQRGELPPDAPDPEVIQQVAAGRAPEAVRLQVLDMVMQSEALRREYDLFRALVAASAPVPRRVPRQLVALAAALLGVVMVGSLWWRQQPIAEPWRGGAGAVMLLEPVKGAHVSPPVALRWSGVPGATSYALEVLAANGNVLFHAAGEDTLVVLPQSVALVPGEAYVWRVVAKISDGRQVESEPGSFSGAP